MVMFLELEVKKAKRLRKPACGQAHGENSNQQNRDTWGQGKQADNQGWYQRKRDTQKVNISS